MRRYCNNCKQYVKTDTSILKKPGHIFGYIALFLFLVFAMTVGYGFYAGLGMGIFTIIIIGIISLTGHGNNPTCPICKDTNFRETESKK